MPTTVKSVPLLTGNLFIPNIYCQCIVAFYLLSIKFKTMLYTTKLGSVYNEI